MPYGLSPDPSRPVTVRGTEITSTDARPATTRSWCASTRAV